VINGTTKGVDIMAGTVLELGKSKYRLMVSGKYDGSGKRIRRSKTITAKSKREAEKELAKFVVEYEQGDVMEGDNMTLREFSKRWIEEYARQNLSPITVKGYERELDNRINPALGNIKLGSLMPMHLIRFYNSLDTAKRLDGKEGKLSGRSKNNIHRIISSMLNDAMQWQLISYNPASRVQPPKQEKHKAKFYDEVQSVKMLACLEEEELKYKVAVYIAILTGMRRGEILGLEWKDIDYEKNEISIERTSVYAEGLGVFTKSTKTENSQRIVSFPNELVVILKKYYKQYLAQRLKCGELWKETDRLMIQWNGEPMFPSTLTQWFKKFLTKHELPIITFHQIRHTSATLLIKQGIDIATVAKRLGHSQNTTTLNFYTHAIQSEDRVAADKLGGLLMGVAQ
jgi:integrase